MSSIRWVFNALKWEPTEQEFLKASSCLQIEEKNRIGKFLHKKDVKASLAGRLMIRKFIHETTGLPYDSIEISRDINNKPYFNIKNYAVPVSFNVSHQGFYAVLVGEVGIKTVGVDVMKLEYKGGKPLDHYFHIMKKNFTDTEWKKIENSSDNHKINLFCRNWALKESYLKAIGKGLTVNLRSLCFKINSELQENVYTTDTNLYINNQKQNWVFQETLIDSLHCVAIALERETYNDKQLSNSPLFQELSPADLLKNAIPILPEDLTFCKEYFLKNA